MKTVLFGLAALVLAHSSTALACTYHIDDAMMGAELAKVAEASISGETEISSEVVSSSHFISKNTPMCPEEITYVATIDVTYTMHRSSTCRATLGVEKVAAFADSSQPVTYKVSGHNSARCTR